MNPILKTRGNIIAYAALVFVLAAAYGILLGMGSGTGAGNIAIDILIYGLAWGFMGIVLWNLLSYAVPKRNGVPSPIWTAFTGLISSVFIVGIECLVMWAALDSRFGLFSPSIPVRIFITALIFVIILLYYKGYEVGTAADEASLQPVVKADNAKTIERITLKTGGKIKVISLNDIEYLQADGDYVAIVTGEGRWLKEQTMKYFEENLPMETFIRIHRSYIVGIPKITRIERYGNLYQVALRNGEKIKVSANGYKLLKERMSL